MCEKRREGGRERVAEMEMEKRRQEGRERKADGGEGAAVGTEVVVGVGAVVGVGFGRAVQAGDGVGVADGDEKDMKRKMENEM